MTTNEIKKELYKQKPQAEFIMADKNNLYYQTSLKSGQIIFFWIPLKDIQEAIFKPVMESQLLIRYVQPIVEPQP